MPRKRRRLKPRSLSTPPVLLQSRSSRRRQWTDKSMLSAIEAVKGGMSMLRAATAYNASNTSAVLGRSLHSSLVTPSSDICLPTSSMTLSPGSSLHPFLVISSVGNSLPSSSSVPSSGSGFPSYYMTPSPGRGFPSSSVTPSPGRGLPSSLMTPSPPLLLSNMLSWH